MFVELILLFILGLFLGSYLNVLILRKEFSKTGGRSICPECKTQLKWYDLIPLISFITLKGKCRYCKTEISYQYPIVELLSGLIFITPFLFGLGIFESVVFIVSSLFLLVLSVQDIKNLEVSSQVLWSFVIIGFLFGIYGFIGSFDYEILISGLILWLPFFCLSYFSSERLMGFGDAIVIFPIGFLIGSYIGVVSLFFLTFWLGALYSVVLLIFRRYKVFSIRVPLIPFIFLAYIYVYLYGVL